MDARLRLARSSGAIPTCPPEAPLAMPAQPVDLPRVKPAPELDGRWRLGVIVIAAALITGLAAYEMYNTLNVSGMTVLEWVVLVLFCLNFAWISSASATAFAGFFTLLAAPRAKPVPAASTDPSIASRTVIILPMYNEQPARVLGGAEAVWDALVAAGAASHFEIFFLSDTTDPEIALAEEAAFTEIRARRPGAPFFYRRRTINRHRKSGNVHDFVERWGGRYDFMVVFDADSLMSPSTLVELVRRMETRPRTALIQTFPVIVSAQTVFARAQQFAMRAYGPLFGGGVAWWAGGAGNFWGHNAIIRVRAFAAHAGLPSLPGKAPLGGPVLSHDFIEAALLRRAGWRVEIAPDIGGSYEECPPTMVDIAARDRRWAQGNLQHLGLLGAKGFDGVSRAHITAGVMGYLSAVLWLGLILAGLGLSLQGAFLRPAYFGAGESLMPHWPVIDDARAFRLFILTAAIVLSPKWLAMLLWAAGKLPGWTRNPRFLLSLVAEAVLSALMAPVMMLNQAGAVFSTLLGRDAGWRPQVRDREGFAWADLLRHYTPHMVFGAALLGSALAISLVFGAWIAPAALSLLLAAPLSAWAARRPRSGSFLWSLQATPEDLEVPDIVTAAEASTRTLRGVEADRFEEVVASPAAARHHADFVDSRWPVEPGEIHAPTAFVLARLEQDSPETMIARMGKAERMAALNRPDLLERIAAATAAPSHAAAPLSPTPVSASAG
ncbi:MAG: glucans biosynthesis glucosyltransferase MdoH [Alphaproteobacteria bacterium]|nr:glucans biosynthesis glucosyltransferase MdoH [Alphaproteobacteria bacterium]